MELPTSAEVDTSACVFIQTIHVWTQEEDLYLLPCFSPAVSAFQHLLA